MHKPDNAPQLPLTATPEKAGRDEMNLAEYPFASLWRGGGEAPNLIELSWETRDPQTQAPVTATWRVSGDSKLGLPTAFDERLYLVLMQLTKEQGMTQEVRFSQYEVLRRLGCDNAGQSYEMLRDALTRLQGVKIRAENCFYDRKLKGFRTVGFSLIAGYNIEAARRGKRGKDAQVSDLPLSSFRWSDEVFQSMQGGYVKTIDVEFALSLQKPLSLRLFRYLDKKRNRRETYQIALRSLCLNHLGMADADYDSQLKQRLAPAHDELAARGFLGSISFLPMKTQSGEKIVYSFGDMKALPETGDAPKKAPPLPQGDPDETPPTLIDDLCAARLALLEEERGDEYAQIRGDAMAQMGELERDRFNRDPLGEKTAFNLRRRMLDVIHEKYFSET